MPGSGKGRVTVAKLEASPNVAQEFNRWPVAPMQIVDKKQKWLLGGQLQKELGDGIENSHLIGLFPGDRAQAVG